MKICRECSNVCESGAVACPRCGSTHLASVQEKLCVYCKSRIAMGTIICPHCHRVLPPESESKSNGGKAEEVAVSDIAVQKQGGVAFQNITFEKEEPQKQHKEEPTSHVEKQNKQANKSIVNMHISDLVDEDLLITEDQTDKSKESEKVEKTGGFSEFDMQNPLFGIYDTRVKSEPTEVNAFSEDIVEESFESDIESETFENSVVENREFETGVITHVQPTPQNKFIVYGLFVLMIICNAVALWTVYMTHAMGDVLGYEMSAAVFVDYRDVFPSIYPYILYGSNLLARYQLLGSHLPFAMNFAMMFAFVGGITMIVSAIPKWVSATFNGIAIACHLFGMYVINMLFGFRSIGISAYIYLISALAVFVLHLIVVRKE